MPPALIDDASRALLDRIDARSEDMIARTIAWSAINSGSDNMEGLARMGECLCEAFSALGADYARLDLAPAQWVDDRGEMQERPLGPVHRFRKRPEARRQVLLTGHLDTVFPADSAFQTPKWHDDETLNGPGVADMKGGLVVMLEALRTLEQAPMAEHLGYEILISSDEEIGSIGSASCLVESAGRADFGMTYEPALTDGTLAGARKGSGNFTLVVHGRAAHAGRAIADGRNAVVMLARLIARLEALNGERDQVTVNPAVISGGTAPNIVPDIAVLRFNIRVGSEEDRLWAEREIARILADFEGQEGYRLALHGGFNRPPKPMTPENLRLFEALRGIGGALGLAIDWKATGGCCEGNNLAAAGLPNIDTLGVRGGLIHSPGEFALKSSFAERAKLSAALLLAYAGGALDGLGRRRESR